MQLVKSNSVHKNVHPFSNYELMFNTQIHSIFNFHINIIYNIHSDWTLYNLHEWTGTCCHTHMSKAKFCYNCSFTFSSIRFSKGIMKISFWIDILNDSLKYRRYTIRKQKKPLFPINSPCALDIISSGFFSSKEVHFTIINFSLSKYEQSQCVQSMHCIVYSVYVTSIKFDWIIRCTNTAPT